MIRRFRLRQAARHVDLAQQHQATLDTALQLYQSICDTPAEAVLRLDELTSTDYHRARIRLHLALADKWNPDTP